MQYASHLYELLKPINVLLGLIMNCRENIFRHLVTENVLPAATASVTLPFCAWFPAIDAAII
jgi:hypothetical protein